MSVQSTTLPPSQLAASAYSGRLPDQGRAVETAAGQDAATGEPSSELREAFDSFVGQSFYGMLMKTMRQSLNKSPYFHGGRGEEVFQQQLDQVLVERMSEASAESFTGPMFELFTMRRH